MLDSNIPALGRRDLLRGAFSFLVAPPAAARKPNIVLILMDDMAQRAISCYGNPYVPTPNVDRLAKEGMRFTDAYVTPQCTPTRATILTGQYTARNKMWHVIPKYGYPWARVKEPDCRDGLSRDDFLLSKGLQAAGYTTGCYGKWHLTANADGDYTALKAEAAHYYGFHSVAAPGPPREIATGDKGVNRLTAEAVRFVEANRTRPFFLYLAHHTIHGPVLAPPELVAKYRAKGFPDTGLHNATYLAALEHMDRAIGTLLAKLDELKLTDSTAVFFLTDNGGVQHRFNRKAAESNPRKLVKDLSEFSNEPLRAGKGSSYEGGIRVPLLVRWPGVAPPGAVCRTPVHAVDLMPTLFEIAGAKIPPGYATDGVSLLPLLRGDGRIPDRALYFFMPFYDILWAHTPSAAIREGDWKLIEFFGDYIHPETGDYSEGNRLELYNLRDDIGERNNLAAKDPARTARMRDKLHRWIRSCGSAIPGPNPNFDPAKMLTQVSAGRSD
jgi:arylsulfatase A